tara:strand:+ start:2253 stop:4346 length:2094 start_codon:yes stop_codon:yes gene_type:complete
MRFKATIFVLIVLLSSLVGCLKNENPAPAGSDDEAGLNKFEFKIPGRSLIIGEIEVTNLFEEQRSMFHSIIQHQRSIDFNSDEVPNQGGNWTHYFVCSDGEKIDYDFPKPEFFTCDTTGEILVGEQYNSSWIAFRHKEVIRSIAIESAVSYYLTNNTSDGENAREILLHYASIYADLPIQDKFGNTGGAGGKLTRQSLDEAVYLIDLAWIHYLIQPMLSTEQDQEIINGLILPMVETLQTPANQNRDSLSNWFSYHNAAIGMAAVSTNNSSMMQDSLAQWNGLYHQLEFGFDDDGLWHEGSIAYHNYTLTAMAINFEAARFFGIDLRDYSWQTSGGSTMAIYQPFVSHLAFVKPDGTFPRLNDDIQGTDLSSIIDLLEFSNRYWPGQVPHSYLEKARDMSEKASLRSCFWRSPFNTLSMDLGSANFESFGVSIIRHNDLFILLDYGPHGGWHGHFDKLNIEISSNRSNLISDPGTVVYSLPSSNDWYRTSFAHSLPFIGFENQPETTGRLLNHNFTTESSFVMAEYTDEKNGMNVTRLLLVLSTSQYGDVVLDVSHWSGSQANIATQTYHFSNSLDSIEFSNSSELPTPESIEQYTQLELIENNHTFFTNSAQYWQTAIHVSKGNELYGGTSINGGLFLIQTNAQPSTNSTMLSIHQNGEHDEFIQFDQILTDSSIIVMLDELEIRIDWDTKSVAIE